jgi:N-acetylmuramoyl-L-alanine amidase
MAFQLLIYFFEMQTNKQVFSNKSFGLLGATRTGLILLVIFSIGALNASAQQNAARKRQAKSKAVRVALSVEEIREAEQTLSDLGYWTGPIDGKLDEASRHALIAFQKVESRRTSGRLSKSELEAIRNASRPSPRESGFAHIEADLSRQVLFIIDATGQVTKILPISSGNGKEFTSEGWTRRAITPLGRFKVHRQVEGWRKAPLGDIYYPNYFLSGVAIHGYPSVPVVAASHGCIRIPIFAAKEFTEMTPIGTPVIVHDGGPIDPDEDARYNPLPQR